MFKGDESGNTLKILGEELTRDILSAQTFDEI